MPEPRDEDLLYRSFSETLDRPCERSQGALPAGLSGTFLRVGPGLQRVGADPLAFFDAHTLVAGLRIRDGAARLLASPVRTPLLDREERAGKQLARRTMTNLPGWWPNFLNLKLGITPMQDVIRLGQRLFVLSEQSYWELDPETLQTRGELALPVKRGAQDWLAFMPRLTPDGTRLVAQVIRRSGLKPDTAEFFELDEELAVHRSVSAKLVRNNAFVHEQAYSERFHVQFEFPLKLSALGALAGRRPVLSCFEPEDRPCVLHLVPRDGGEALRLDCPGPARAAFHVANAYDEGDRLIVDAVVEEAMPDLAAAAPAELKQRQQIPDAPTPPGRLVRYTVDVKARTVITRPLASIEGEQPIVPRGLFGRRHRHVYMATPGGRGTERDPAAFLVFHAVARVDTDTGAHSLFDFGPRCYVGQPAFAPRPGGRDEDDGWLVTWVLDAGRGRTSVAILDAAAVERGPVAVVDTGTLLPGYNHARFYGS